MLIFAGIATGKVRSNLLQGKAINPVITPNILTVICEEIQIGFDLFESCLINKVEFD